MKSFIEVSKRAAQGPVHKTRFFASDVSTMEQAGGKHATVFLNGGNGQRIPVHFDVEDADDVWQEIQVQRHALLGDVLQRGLEVEARKPVAQALAVEVLASFHRLDKATIDKVIQEVHSLLPKEIDDRIQALLQKSEEPVKRRGKAAE